MKKVGVTTSVIRRGKNSGVLSITEAFSDSEREAMQNMLNTIYDQFTRKAAEGRKMNMRSWNPSRVAESTRGRKRWKLVLLMS